MFLNCNSHDVKIRYIPGKDPTMVFLNADNKVVLVSAYHEVYHLLLVLSSTLLHLNSGRKWDKMLRLYLAVSTVVKAKISISTRHR